MIGGGPGERIGRLAQLWLERLLDMQEVTGSSPVSPTIEEEAFLFSSGLGSKMG